MLNGRPYLLRMVLDQGYWPDTLHDRARATTRCGATSSWPRRWASTACASTRRSRTRATCTGPTGSACWSGRRCRRPTASRAPRSSAPSREWTEAIERDYSHPCIVVWVPFNESWGVPELTADAARSGTAVEALYHLTKTLDATRPVIGNDGWESSATDIIGIHDYDANTEHLRQRYGPEIEPAAAVRPAPARRPHPDARRLSAPRPADHADRVRRHRLRRVPADRRRRRPGATSVADDRRASSRACSTRCCTPSIHTALFSGFCYTQFADTFQEANGLLHADRTPKIPLEHDRRAATAAVAHAHPPAASEPARVDDALARARQARRPRADALRSPPAAAPVADAPSPFADAARGASRTCAGIRCAASGSPTPRTARTAPSCRRPSTTRSRPPSTRRTRPSCRPGDWDVAVFDNRFPTLGGPARRPAAARSCRRAPAQRRTARSSSSRRTATASLGALAARPHRAAARGLGRPHRAARRARRRRATCCRSRTAAPRSA